MSSGSTWSIATAEDEGKALIFRIRNEAPTFATRATFQNLLAVSWQFDATSNNGMPLASEVERMQQLEDLLEPVFFNNRQAFLTLVVTGNGVREWQWYARDQNTVMKLVNETLGELDPFPVQFSFQNDPDWQAYSQFLEILHPKGS
jgi:hypothetical protein